MIILGNNDMVKNLATLFILLIIFACTDKAKYSETLNGTWINSITSDTYFFNYPDIEFILAEDVQKIAQRINGKGGVKVAEGFKGTYEADETKVYITYKQDMFNGTWHDIDNREIAEIPFQYRLDGDTLNLTNAFGKELRFNRKKE